LPESPSARLRAGRRTQAQLIANLNNPAHCRSMTCDTYDVNSIYGSLPPECLFPLLTISTAKSFNSASLHKPCGSQRPTGDSGFQNLFLRPRMVAHSAVLTLYLGLPETPLRASPQDNRHASQLYHRGVSLPVIESALLLASLRRLLRPADLPPLSPVRSLAYFQPVIDKLLANPAPDSYLDYLRFKLRHISSPKTTP
jgi:hypothetical protein